MRFDVSLLFTGVVKMSIARSVYFLAVICALVYCENIRDDSLLTLIENRDSLNTKNVIKGVGRILNAYCEARGSPTCEFEASNAQALNEKLKKFNAELRTKKRTLYSKKSMLSISRNNTQRSLGPTQEKEHVKGKTSNEQKVVEDRWKQWWGYDLMAGPEMWGRTGPYKMCSNGKQQSPIDIHPDMLLFDPNLKHVKVETVPVNGKLTNTGNDITLFLDHDFIHHVNVSQGPLSYVYHVTALKFHYSKVDINGSEHRIAGRSFPAELQIIGYNGDLYENMSRAENSSNGIVVISTFLEIAPEKTDENPALDVLTAKLDEISWERGAFVQITSFSIDELLPLTEHYITYEGSMTQPSCQETVTWIIFNKPSYISEKQLNAFRGVWMEWQMKNIRPAMPLNHRVLRTNINTRKQSGLCSMKRDLFYDVNSNFRTT